MSGFASNQVIRAAGVVALIFVSLAGRQADAGPFTGPVSPYYLDDSLGHKIYVVQGTKVTNNFSWDYASGGTGYQEASLAVTNVVSTNWLGTAYGSPGTGGQYTLDGTPTGTSWTNSLNPPGTTYELLSDGTSDGQHNYTVEYYSYDGTGKRAENVIRTDANWQNPTVLFSVQTSPSSTVANGGIAYDPNNNSLWISGYNMSSIIRNYDLDGNLLSSFDTGLDYMGALAYDPADGTLWFSYFGSTRLYQYSITGVLLQSGVPTGLPSNGGYYTGEISPLPEPASLALFGVGLTGIGFWRRKRAARKLHSIRR